MKSLGLHEVLWKVMSHQNNQNALKANCEIPNCVIHQDSNFSINVSEVELPLVIHEMEQVGIVKVFLDKNLSQVNQPEEQTFEYRCLIPIGNQID